MTAGYSTDIFTTSFTNRLCAAESHFKDKYLPTMAKKIKTKSKDKPADANAAATPAEAAPLVIGDAKAAFDPALASLFANSVSDSMQL